MLPSPRNRNLLGEHARAMSALLDFSEQMAVATDLDTVLDVTLDTTAQLLCSRRVSIMLPDAEGEFLTIARSIGIEDPTAAVRVPIGSAVAGCVFQSAEPVIANTPGQHPSGGYDSELFVSIPLVSRATSAGQRTLGVLNVTEKLGRKPFAPLELEYVNLICRIAASVMERILARNELDDAQASLVVALAKLAEHRDNDTGRHLDRVSEFAQLLAEQLRAAQWFGAQIDETFLADLKRAVPLHDIGKVAVPDNVLLKPGKLTPQEMAIMRRHPAVGAATIQSVIQRAPKVRFLKMAEDVAHAHHEWYDGSGYPRGLAGDAIPLAARITALADVYDAITTKRPYKEAMPHEKAVAIIGQSCGTQFDPALVDAFRTSEPEFARAAARLADDAPIPDGATAKPRRPQVS